MLRCSASKIRRLRKSGSLAYLRGRPVLIERSALDAYLASIRQEPKPLVVNEEFVSPEVAEQTRVRAQKAAAKMRQRALMKGTR